MVAVVVLVDLEGRGFPVSGVAPEYLVGDYLEGGVPWSRGLIVGSVPHRGEHDPGPVAGLVHADGPGPTDDLPDPPAVVLAMDEVPLGARGQTPDAEALQVAVAGVVDGLAGLESVDSAFVEA